LVPWVVIGYCNVVACCIVLSPAVTLNVGGVTNIATAAQAAAALKPLAGQFAFVLFALGIVSTGMLAVPVLAGSAAYALAEARGWKEGLGKRLGDAREFYAVILFAIAAGVALADFNKDGLLDLVLIGAEGARVLFRRHPAVARRVRYQPLADDTPEDPGERQADLLLLEGQRRGRSRGSGKHGPAHAGQPPESASEQAEHHALEERACRQVEQPGPGPEHADLARPGRLQQRAAVQLHAVETIARQIIQSLRKRFARGKPLLARDLQRKSPPRMSMILTIGRVPPPGRLLLLW